MAPNPKMPIRPIHGKDRNNYEQVHDRVDRILDGNVSLGGMSAGNASELKGHIDNKHVSVTSPVASNTEFVITHNLNRVPSGVIPVQNSNGGVVYASGTAWTTTQIFLKCTTGSCGLVLQIY